MLPRPLVPALLAALVLAAPGAAPAAEGGALGEAADELAARLAEGTAPDRVALTATAPGADGLAEPFAAALAGALSRRGYAPLPLRGRESPEAAARAAGADRLARIRVALSAGGRELAATAEVTAARENFFLQRAPGAGPVRLLAVAVPADAVVRTLARPAGPSRLAAPTLVPLFALPERVVALAVLPAGDAAAVLAATPGGLLLLSAAGQRLAVRPAPVPAPGHALRDDAAALAVGDFGGGRIAWQPAGAPEAEVLSLEAGRLEPVATLPAAPLAAGGAGRLFGRFAPGVPDWEDRVSSTVDPGPLRSPRVLQGAAAAPHPGRAAFALLHADDAAEILDAALAPVGRVEGVGAGFALADVNGDGEPELVASSAEPAPEDRVRVLRLAPAAETLFQSQPVPGAIRAAAAGDLTGDGADDVVLAALQPDGSTRVWLLTADPREAAR